MLNGQEFQSLFLVFELSQPMRGLLYQLEGRISLQEELKV